jgi:opacity protein-like surface antigen
MKLSLFGATAIVVLASAAGAADMQPVLKAPGTVEQQATGYVEVYSGWARTEGENEGVQDRVNGWALGGAGRGNYWLNPGMSVQVDAQAEGTSYDDGRFGHFSTHSYLIGGHWSWRNPQQYLFGLFGGVGDSGGGGFDSSQRHGLIGAEAQWYWHQFTLYGQVGYDTTLNSGNFADTINAWFIRGTGRYFINPNVLIEGTVMYANGNIDRSPSSIDFQTWTWGVKAEWRFATSPFSVFAKYQGSETTYDDISFLRDAKVTDHRVLLGLKLYMGDRTLQQTDRAGATLDIISPLANPTSPLMFGPPVLN